MSVRNIHNWVNCKSKFTKLGFTWQSLDYQTHTTFILKNKMHQLPRYLLHFMLLAFCTLWRKPVCIFKIPPWFQVSRDAEWNEHTRTCDVLLTVCAEKKVFEGECIGAVSLRVGSFDDAVIHCRRFGAAVLMINKPGKLTLLRSMLVSQLVASDNCCSNTYKGSAGMTGTSIA